MIRNVANGLLVRPILMVGAQYRVRVVVCASLHSRSASRQLFFPREYVQTKI